MSRFFSKRYEMLTPYTPGEQPQNQEYIKLNTNESPFPPSEKAMAFGREELRTLNLYSDPECKRLIAELAKTYGVSEDMITVNNGSDETLNFSFMAFCDDEHPAAFADITYGFYPVFAQLNGIPYTEIPLKEDFSIDPEDYIGIGKTIFIANPNSPTGVYLPLEQIERIAASNPDNVVIVDEAYVDFGGESAVSLLDRCSNILVIRTFSKSRSMAGGRLGFGIGSKELIADLNTIRFSTNPYNVNSLTESFGLGILKDPQYMKDCCETIIANREFTLEELRKRGFAATDSKANFVFAKSDRLDGEKLYLALKEKGILVRHFTKEKIRDYNRISIGTRAQMESLLKAIDEILEGQK